MTRIMPRPRVGAVILSVCHVTTPGQSVAEVTNEPITAYHHRDGTVTRDWGVRLACSDCVQWVAAEDCRFEVSR